MILHMAALLIPCAGRSQRRRARRRERRRRRPAPVQRLRARQARVARLPPGRRVPRSQDLRARQGALPTLGCKKFCVSVRACVYVFLTTQRIWCRLPGRTAEGAVPAVSRHVVCGSPCVCRCDRHPSVASSRFGSASSGMHWQERWTTHCCAYIEPEQADNMFYSQRMVGIVAHH